MQDIIAKFTDFIQSIVQFFKDLVAQLRAIGDNKGKDPEEE